MTFKTFRATKKSNTKFYIYDGNMIASKERRNFIEKDSSRAGGDGPACACAVRTSYPWWGGGGRPHRSAN